MGPLKGKYLDEEAKEKLVKIVQEVEQQYTMTPGFCCRILKLPVKRYQRWARLYRQTGRYGDGRPGPKQAPHALTQAERDKIIEVSKDDRFMDLSHRQLAVTASELGEVEAGASTFYRVMKEENLMEERARTTRTPQSKPEVKPKAPNDIWSWDLTYIPLGAIFVYLFAIIDVHSRKIVGWHLSFNATLESMKMAWDDALSKEKLLDLIGAPQMPTALSDHGVQMARKSAKQFFRDLGIKQLFARYQTPTDNAWIESWFKTLKYDELRYQDYISFEQLKEGIEGFINFYNTERYHGMIGYVTPEQKHSGKAEKILKARAERKKEARRLRMEFHRNNKLGQNREEKAA